MSIIKYNNNSNTKTNQSYKTIKNNCNNKCSKIYNNNKYCKNNKKTLAIWRSRKNGPNKFKMNFRKSRFQINRHIKNLKSCINSHLKNKIKNKNYSNN